MLQFAGGFYTDLITVPKGSHDDFLGSGLRVQNNTQKRLDCLGFNRDQGSDLYTTEPF